MTPIGAWSFGHFLYVPIWESSSSLGCSLHSMSSWVAVKKRWSSARTGSPSGSGCFIRVRQKGRKEEKTRGDHIIRQDKFSFTSACYFICVIHWLRVLCLSLGAFLCSEEEQKASHTISINELLKHVGAHAWRYIFAAVGVLLRHLLP